MEFYHVIWGSHSLDLSKPISPRVPNNTMNGEDKSIGRICVSTSLDDCLTGLGPVNIGLHYLSENLRQHDNKIELTDVTLPFTVAKFNMDRGDPSVMLPGKVAKYVPDAFLSQECWITNPTIPEEALNLWLIDGTLVKGSMLDQGEKCTYYYVTDTKWSTTEQKADLKFVQDLFDVTKVWLSQNKDWFKDCSEIKSSGKPSLSDQIQSASIRAVESYPTDRSSAKESTPQR